MVSCRIYDFHEHMNRMIDSAKAMAFEDIPSKGFVRVVLLVKLR